MILRFVIGLATACALAAPSVPVFAEEGPVCQRVVTAPMIQAECGTATRLFKHNQRGTKSCTALYQSTGSGKPNYVRMIIERFPSTQRAARQVNRLRDGARQAATPEGQASDLKSYRTVTFAVEDFPGNGFATTSGAVPSRKYFTVSVQVGRHRLHVASSYGPGSPGLPCTREQLKKLVVKAVRNLQIQIR